MLESDEGAVLDERVHLFSPEYPCLILEFLGTPWLWITLRVSSGSGFSDQHRLSTHVLPNDQRLSAFSVFFQLSRLIHLCYPHSYPPGLSTCVIHTVIHLCYPHSYPPGLPTVIHPELSTQLSTRVIHSYPPRVIHFDSQSAHQYYYGLSDK